MKCSLEVSYFLVTRPRQLVRLSAEKILYTFGPIPAGLIIFIISLHKKLIEKVVSQKNPNDFFIT